MAITDEAEEEGVVKENERTFIKNLMKFKSVEAKDIMTPFSVAVTEDEEMTIAAFLKKHKKLKFSRIPVFKSSPNNITGFILKDDVLEEMIDNNGKEPLDSLKRELLITESSTPIPRLFDFFVENQAHIAVVTDEFGNNVGLITMEDIIETLLGLEIMDENDSVEDMQHLARKNWEERAERIGIISKADGEEEEKDGQNENRNQRNGENKS
jgi:CBS domain containing-hemolysin-like protein